MLSLVEKLSSMLADNKPGIDVVVFINQQFQSGRRFVLWLSNTCVCGRLMVLTYH